MGGYTPGGGAETGEGTSRRPLLLRISLQPQKEDKDHQLRGEAQPGDQAQDPGGEDIPQPGIGAAAHHRIGRGAVRGMGNRKAISGYAPAGRGGAGGKAGAGENRLLAPALTTA